MADDDMTLVWNGTLTDSEAEMIAYALRHTPMTGPDFTEDDRPAFDALAERFERAARP